MNDKDWDVDVPERENEKELSWWRNIYIDWDDVFKEVMYGLMLSIALGIAILLWLIIFAIIFGGGPAY